MLIANIVQLISSKIAEEPAQGKKEIKIKDCSDNGIEKMGPWKDKTGYLSPADYPCICV